MCVAALMRQVGHSTALVPLRVSPLKCSRSASSTLSCSAIPRDRKTKGTGASTSVRPQHVRCLVFTVRPENTDATSLPSAVPVRPASTTSISFAANSLASFCCHTGLGRPRHSQALTRSFGSYADRLPPRSHRKARCSSSSRRERARRSGEEGGRPSQLALDADAALAELAASACCCVNGRMAHVSSPSGPVGDCVARGTVSAVQTPERSSDVIVVVDADAISLASSCGSGRSA